MTEEYPELVLSTYKKMRDNGELHTIIPKATTAALKNACLKVYDSRYNPEDADILSVFFNVDKMKCDFRKVISDVKSDYFKALYNHIREGTDTNERNTDLLAWLIDFKPRPSGLYYKNLRELNKLTETASGTVEIATNEIEQNSAKEEADIELQKKESENLKEFTTTIDEAENEQEHIVKPTTPPIVVIPIKTEDVKINGGSIVPPPTIHNKPEYVPRFSPRYITISCIVLLFIGTTSFAIWERWTKIRMPNSDEKYMYWDGDHYEPIKDDKQNVGAPIIPLNVRTLTQQRKINLPDTLTNYSIGKVWYKGHGKDHEFFTDSGSYPKDIQRVLKPLTSTILTKYTSNYRYMLTRFVWFLCAAFFISLFGFAVSKLEKEVKHTEEETKTEKEETTAYHNNELQATRA